MGQLRRPRAGPYANNTPFTGLRHQSQWRKIVYAPFPEATLTLTGEATIIFNPSQVTLTFDADTLGQPHAVHSGEQPRHRGGIVHGAVRRAVRNLGARRNSTSASDCHPLPAGCGHRSGPPRSSSASNTDTVSHNVRSESPDARPGWAGQFIHESFSLDAGSFGLYLVGSLTLKKGPIDFNLDGIFDIDFLYNAGDWKFDSLRVCPS